MSTEETATRLANISVIGLKMTRKATRESLLFLMDFLKEQPTAESKTKLIEDNALLWGVGTELIEKTIPMIQQLKEEILKQDKHAAVLVEVCLALILKKVMQDIKQYEENK